MPHKTAETSPATTGRVLHWARLYDVQEWVMPFLRAIREKLIELAALAPGEHALDVGCGTGSLAIALKSRVPAAVVDGIDASPEMIELAKDKAEKAGHRDREDPR